MSHKLWVISYETLSAGRVLHFRRKCFKSDANSLSTIFTYFPVVHSGYKEKNFLKKLKWKSDSWNKLFNRRTTVSYTVSFFKKIKLGIIERRITIIFPVDLSQKFQHVWTAFRAEFAMKDDHVIPLFLLAEKSCRNLVVEV